MSESVKYKIIKILSEQTLLDPSEIKDNLSLEDLGIGQKQIEISKSIKIPYDE